MPSHFRSIYSFPLHFPVNFCLGGKILPQHQGTGSSSSEGFSTLGRASTKTANVNVDGPLLLSYEWRDYGVPF